MKYETDSRGNTFGYEGDKCLYKRLPDGEERWFDIRGNLIRAKYPNGKELRFDFDADGKLTCIVSPDGTENHFCENGEYLLKYPDGRQERYNASSRLIYEKWSTGLERWFDEHGNTVNVTPPEKAS